MDRDIFEEVKHIEREAEAVLEKAEAERRALLEKARADAEAYALATEQKLRGESEARREAHKRRLAEELEKVDAAFEKEKAALEALGRSRTDELADWVVPRFLSGSG